MDLLESGVKSDDVFNGIAVFCIVVCQELVHLRGNILWLCCFQASDGVGSLFIVSHCKPVKHSVPGVVLQNVMQMLDHVFSQRLICAIDYIVDCTEMVDRLKHIVYRNALTDVECVCFKD